MADEGRRPEILLHAMTNSPRCWLVISVNVDHEEPVEANPDIGNATGTLNVAAELLFRRADCASS